MEVTDAMVVMEVRVQDIPMGTITILEAIQELKTTQTLIPMGMITFGLEHEV